VRMRVVVTQQPVLLPPKFRVKSSHIFTQSQQNVTVVCGIGCLACQDKYLDVKENVEDALDFALYLSRLFRSRRI
jgi:hypothetical protein